ncbi:unnamed protein product [Amoebophrya sp. A25]|nr:unnamed protein product [Amoebophrya sp. A25]|eukprot:GSA25T00006822001.1
MFSSTRPTAASARDPSAPRKLPQCRPQVYVNGEVECAGICATGMTQLYCSFRFRYIRANWWLLAGDERGETFISDGHNGMCVWNHPFDAHFAALSLEGWPRLEVIVRGKDGDGRNQVAGYGQVLVPTRPGGHELIVQCWRPVEDVLRQQLLAEVPEFVDEQHEQLYVSTPNKSKAQLRAEDSVEVLIRFNVTLQDFKSNNLVVS